MRLKGANMKDTGWIKLSRKILNNSLWELEPFTKAQAWIDLLLLANHKEGLLNVRGNVLRIKRGQVGWSEVKLSERWKWSRNKVRRFLNWLEMEQQIEQQKNKISSIITITNYDEYQQKGQQTIQQKDNRRYTNKNDKNVKKYNYNKNQFVDNSSAHRRSVDKAFKETEDFLAKYK